MWSYQWEPESGVQGIRQSYSLETEASSNTFSKFADLSKALASFCQHKNRYINIPFTFIQFGSLSHHTGVKTKCLQFCVLCILEVADWHEASQWIKHRGTGEVSKPWVYPKPWKKIRTVSHGLIRLVEKTLTNIYIHLTFIPVVWTW